MLFSRVASARRYWGLRDSRGGTCSYGAPRRRFSRCASTAYSVVGCDATHRPHDLSLTTLGLVRGGIRRCPRLRSLASCTVSSPSPHARVRLRGFWIPCRAPSSSPVSPWHWLPEKRCLKTRRVTGSSSRSTASSSSTNGEHSKKRLAHDVGWAMIVRDRDAGCTCRRTEFPNRDCHRRGQRFRTLASDACRDHADMASRTPAQLSSRATIKKFWAYLARARSWARRLG